MFENGIKKEKKMFFVLSRAWEKEKNSESPRGVEPQTFGFPRSDAHDTTEPQRYYGERGSLQML